MVAIITGRVPRYTQSLHRAHTGARAPSMPSSRHLRTGHARKGPGWQIVARGRKGSTTAPVCTAMPQSNTK